LQTLVWGFSSPPSDWHSRVTTILLKCLLRGQQQQQLFAFRPA
jgi:hypothetical protein